MNLDENLMEYISIIPIDKYWGLACSVIDKVESFEVDTCNIGSDSGVTISYFFYIRSELSWSGDKEYSMISLKN